LGHSLTESFISADISQKVEGKLAALGTTVLLTRMTKSKDIIDEQQRAVFANNSNADLVVSIHTDAIKNPSGNGCASYYFGNESLGQKSSMGQRFANIVQSEIIKTVGLKDCRTHAKTWDLLRMTRMPAVRIEVGYLSNTEDAVKLSDANVRDLIAASIAEAIISFFEPVKN
jgi:N-acetylmuramoyl-L-alanine amidase